MLALLLLSSTAWGSEAAVCAQAAEDAQRARDEGKLSEAKKKLLQCSKSECPKVVSKDCVAWLEEVSQSMRSVVVRAKDADGKDADGTLFVDDAQASDHLDGTAIELDPGRHRLRVVLSDGRELGQTVTIATGEKNRLVTLSEKGKPKAKPVPMVKKKETASSSAAPWILGGVGVAGLVTFGTLELIAQGEYSDMLDGCGATRSCSDGELSPIRTKFVAAGVALGVGVVALGSGITWKLLESDPKEDAARIELSPAAGGALLRARGSF